MAVRANGDTRDAHAVSGVEYSLVEIFCITEVCSQDRRQEREFCTGNIRAAQVCADQLRVVQLRAVQLRAG